MKLSRNLLIAAFFICLQPALFTMHPEVEITRQQDVQKYKNDAKLMEKHSSFIHRIKGIWSDEAANEYKNATQAKKELDDEEVNDYKNDKTDRDRILNNRWSRFLNRIHFSKYVRLAQRAQDEIDNAQKILNTAIKSMNIHPSNKPFVKLNELQRIPAKDIQYLDLKGINSDLLLNTLVDRFQNAFPGKPLPENLQNALIDFSQNIINTINENLTENLTDRQLMIDLSKIDTNSIENLNLDNVNIRILDALKVLYSERLPGQKLPQNLQNALARTQTAPMTPSARAAAAATA